VSDDREEKLPTDEALPTSANGGEKRKEEQADEYVVDLGRSYVHYYRGLDGKLHSREYLAEELIDEDISDEDLRRAERIKTIDLDAILAIQEADKHACRAPVNRAGIEEPPLHSSSADLKLHFSKSELEHFVEHRKTGLRTKSVDWITRAAQALWDCTHGDVSYETVTALRTFALEKYNSVESHSKVLTFAKSFLTFLTKTKEEPRYQTFAPYLEPPKTVKERKSVTSRIVTQKDITNVLKHIEKAERAGKISPERSAQYSAFVLFGAYTGQRSEATLAKLTVGQFRVAMGSEKPVLLVDSSQDKIRMSHYVPLHPRVVEALKPLLVGRDDDELMFTHSSFLQWIKRQKIPMSRFQKPFVLGDLRKVAEQHGDVIQWDQSNRAYILTHGVSGVDWSHYKHPLPENVYDIYMKYWENVDFTV